jgi:hypothetical protein
MHTILCSGFCIAALFIVGLSLCCAILHVIPAVLHFGLQPCCVVLGIMCTTILHCVGLWVCMPYQLICHWCTLIKLFLSCALGLCTPAVLVFGLSICCVILCVALSMHAISIGMPLVLVKHLLPCALGFALLLCWSMGYPYAVQFSVSFLLCCTLGYSPAVLCLGLWVLLYCIVLSSEYVCHTNWYALVLVNYKLLLSCALGFAFMLCWSLGYLCAVIFSISFLLYCARGYVNYCHALCWALSMHAIPIEMPLS